MNILMISSTFPYPPSRGGTEIRTFNLLKYLHSKHHVTLVTQRHSEVNDREIEELRQWVTSLVIFPLKSEYNHNLISKIKRFLKSVKTSTPPNVLHRYSPEMQAWIDDYILAGKCDIVTCEHSVNEIYIKPEYNNILPTMVNIHSSVYGWSRNHLEMGASVNIWRDRLYLNLLKRYEKRYTQKFKQIIVTTEDDKNQLLQINPQAKIEIIPNGVDLNLFPYRDRDPGGHKLIFIGAMDASHNIDAVRFFTLEVLPQIQKIYPDTTFTIVGNKPTAPVLKLQQIPGVIITGKVNSVVEYLHQATICVIPLRTGYGIKNKTLEAMAAGIPVVSSDRGLEGLPSNIGALRANTISEYINTISQLFENAQLRKNISHQGRILVEKEYTWDNIGTRYETVLKKR